MFNYIKVTKDQVAPIVRATFPEYRGRKIKVALSDRVYLSDLNWSGGSRSQYRACTLSGEFLGSAQNTTQWRLGTRAKSKAKLSQFHSVPALCGILCFAARIPD